MRNDGINGSDAPRILSSSDAPARQALDGDCACPTTSAHTPARPAPAWDAPLWQTPAVRLVIDPDHTALLSQHHTGRLAVLNRPALAHYDLFRTPRVPHVVVDSATTVDQLWALGLLTDTGLELPPHDAPETLMAWLHMTNACNLRCTYCYVGKTEAHMTAETRQEAVEAVFRAARTNGYRRVQLKYAGGEALLNFEGVLAAHDQAAALAEEAGLGLDGLLLSNGVALGPRHLEALAARNIRLMISLDGLGATHDTQRRFTNGAGSAALTQRGITLARKAGVPVHISITVTPHNADTLAETVGWLLDRELPFAINFYRENDYSADLPTLRAEESRIIAGMRAAFRVLEARPPRFNLLSALVDRANLAAAHTRPCGAGQHYLVIDHRGRVAKCHMQLSQPVSHVQEADPLRAVRADKRGVQNVSVNDKEGCRDCHWKYWCAGGCPVATFRATGRYDIQSPNCGIYQALYPEVVRLEALRILHHAPAMI